MACLWKGLVVSGEKEIVPCLYLTEGWIQPVFLKQDASPTHVADILPG